MQQLTISVAPMIRVSTLAARTIWRVLASDIRLFTEMLHARALCHNPQHPVLQGPADSNTVIQIADNVPEHLAVACRLLARAGWKMINLNAGCPAPSAQAGGFGLALLGDQPRLYECLAAMREAAPVAISLKCRTGIDGRQGTDWLAPIVAQAHAIGCSEVIVHARMGWTTGLNPRQNRTLPQLDYQTPHQVMQLVPEMPITVNGGINSLATVLRLQQHFPSQMIGRWIQQQPLALLDLQAAINGVVTRPRLAEAMLAIMRLLLQQFQQGCRLQPWLLALLPVLAGMPNARYWRRQIQEVMLDNRRFGNFALAWQKKWLQNDPDQFITATPPLSHASKLG